MEKIYMEDNEERKKRRVVDFSVVLSFAVAFFAIFSIAAFGITNNQGMGSISYAAPVTQDSFTFYIGRNNDGRQLRAYDTNDHKFEVSLHCTDSTCKNLVFCYERNIRNLPGVNNNIVYTAGDSIGADYGLLYLLNTFENRQLYKDDVYVDHWLKQVTLWYYLSQNGYENNTINAEDMSILKSVNSITVSDGMSESIGTENHRTVTVDSVFSTIENLVNEANNFAASPIVISETSKNLKLTDDKKYYRTDAYTVSSTSSSALNNYTVSLDNIEGALVVDADGNKVTESIQAGKPFYIYIPVSNVKKETQTLKVKITANFDIKKARVYAAPPTSSGENFQKLIAIDDEDISIPTSFEIEVAGVDDTGINVAHTIYFIGLVILLCGVGIIYANAKPLAKKEQ